MTKDEVTKRKQGGQQVVSKGEELNGEVPNLRWSRKRWTKTWWV